MDEWLQGKLAELAQLDFDSDFYALQCDFRTAAPIAKAYERLRWELECMGVPVPPSISAVRAGVG